MMCYPFCMEEMWRKRIVNRMKSVRNIVWKKCGVSGLLTG